MTDSLIERAKRINRTWIVRGGLADNAKRYLTMLEEQKPGMLARVCARAVKAAHEASANIRDPKPDFYAALFSEASQEERAEYLKDHLWTRTRAEAIQMDDVSAS